MAKNENAPKIRANKGNLSLAKVAAMILDGQLEVTGLGRIPSMYKKRQIKRRDAIFRISQLLNMQMAALAELPFPPRFYMETRGNVPVPFKPIKLKGRNANHAKR